jgi:hypothetical protein
MRGYSMRGAVLFATHAVLRRPLLKRGAFLVLERVPHLRLALRRLMGGKGDRTPRPPYVPQSCDDLSPAALAAYHALQAAFAKRPH